MEDETSNETIEQPGERLLLVEKYQLLRSSKAHLHRATGRDPSSPRQTSTADLQLSMKAVHQVNPIARQSPNLAVVQVPRATAPQDLVSTDQPDPSSTALQHLNLSQHQ